MLSGKVESFENDDKGATWVLNKTTVDQLSTEVQMIMTEDKYKLEKGTVNDAVYGRGNAVLRLILGGFITRFKFNVNITESEGKVMLKLAKGMSGAAGGVMGANKMKKETARLIDKIKAACNE
jgi:hypothetical protein